MAPKKPASERVRDAFGRFASGKAKGQGKGSAINRPGPATGERQVVVAKGQNPRAQINRPGLVNADRSVTVVNTTDPTRPFPARNITLDPAAVRLAARQFVNRMDGITGASGHKLAEETPDAREARIDRIATMWNDHASGEMVQEALSMPLAEVVTEAGTQGDRNASRPKGSPLTFAPGETPLLYK